MVAVKLTVAAVELTVAATTSKWVNAGSNGGVLPAPLPAFRARMPSSVVVKPSACSNREHLTIHKFVPGSEITEHKDTDLACHLWES